MYKVYITNLKDNDVCSYELNNYMEIFNIVDEDYSISNNDLKDLLGKIKVYKDIPNGVDVVVPLNDELNDFIYIYNGSNFWKENGYEKKDLIGTRFTHVFNEKLAKNVLKSIQKVYREDERIDLLLEIYDEEENIILYEIIFFIKVDNSVAMFSQDNTKFEQLKRQEEKLYYTNKEGLLTLNSDFKLLRVNDAFFKILTYTREEFKSVGQFDNSKDYIEALSSLNLNANKIFEEYLEIINHNKFFSELEMSFIDKNGKNKYLRIYITPTIYNGEFAIQSSIRDITEIKEKEDRALHLDETLFSFENLTTAALSYEENGEINWSPGIYKILEIEPLNDDNKNLLSEFVIEEDKNILENNINSFSKEDLDKDFVIRVKTGKGIIKYLHILLNQTYDDNNLGIRIGFYQDVTKLYEYEKQMEETLKTKEFLLSEVHDRVKNNLQLILSLLNLELRYHPDKPEEAVKNTRDRIQNMVLVLELIYKSEDENVDIESYITNRLNDLFKEYNADNITLHQNIENFRIEMDNAIPIGLIGGELARNAIKYAFPNGEKGNFYVKYFYHDSKSVFCCYDDGVGMPKDFDLEASQNLSFIIVKSLVAQLNGTICELDLDKGFGVKIILKH